MQIWRIRDLFSNENTERRSEAEKTHKVGYNLKSNSKRWRFGWEVLLLPWSLTGEHNVSWGRRLKQASTRFKSTLSCAFFKSLFLINLYLPLPVCTPIFSMPKRLECRHRRTNSQIPPSRFLNTRVNNLAQPEQRLNLRESALGSLVYAALSFPVPQEGTVSGALLSLFVTGNFSALFWAFRFDFQPTTRSAAAASVRPSPLFHGRAAARRSCHPPVDLWVVLLDNTWSGRRRRAGITGK